MPYFIESFDKPAHQHIREQLRAEHLRFLDEHKAKLLACGAKLNEDGSNAGGGVYLIDVDTRKAAEQFIAQDPFANAGLFERVNIVKWRMAYLDGKGYL
ncbi:YciI family protein [Cupriavidus sp. NPDC089707]|uniref:YciI family protein n=1 Tax=Cupriavidus sp. NPDC089707 TaxID=3363963 RepID=UPI003800E037